jgi:ubiquinone/menaquinone biosynthesis C-methylase UbiE
MQQMAEFDELAEGYENSMGPFFGMLTERKPKELLRYVSGRGLEVGCGLGQYVRQLNELGCTVIGCDISKMMISEAGRRNGITGVVCDGTRLPFEDNSFDFVYTINTLHHTKNPEEILGEMMRVSKRTVVVGELNIRNPFIWFFSLVMGIDKNADMFAMHRFRNLMAKGSLQARAYYQSFMLVPHVFLWGVLTKEQS